ncbi:MAG TPA: EamA family transporter [Steroidobacteraceae bacterium]|jgi:drug/metabolite transporter (DMT)-like permease
MPGYAVGIVLFAALLHALWNILLKNSGDKRLTTVMLTGAAALLAALILPFLQPPDRASWPFLAASSAAEIGYFLLLAAAYRSGDMSHAYPIMRGTAPLIVASVSASVIGEALSRLEWLGVALICLGVLVLALHGRSPGQHRTTTLLALANAVTIAGYTLIDGLGVRRSHSPAAYTLCMYLVTGSLTLAWTLLTRGAELRAYVRGRLLVAFVAGAGIMSSYGLALWAMTVAPVALVAALRETSIVFATILSVVLLKERISAQRLVATSLIVAGALSLRLA